MKIVSKGYRVFIPELLGTDGFWTFDHFPIVAAKSPSEAKTKASKGDLIPSDFESKYGGYFQYTDLRARREREYDKIEFEGKLITVENYKEHLKKEERNKKIMSLPDELYYVQDMRNYVGNSVLWWALDSNGYTTDIIKAQKYTKDQIIKSFINGRETDKIWPVSHVNQHIKSHVDIQYLNKQNSL